MIYKQAERHKYTYKHKHTQKNRKYTQSTDTDKRHDIATIRARIVNREVRVKFFCTVAHDFHSLKPNQTK